MKYRKLPVVVDAYQLPALGVELPESFFEWCAEVGFRHFYSERDECMMIPTLEGEMIASPNDWIIKGVKGEFYPCKNEIFDETYEKVEDDDA